MLSGRIDWEARLLLKSTSNAVGSWGEYAHATREHISVSDEQKLAALDGIHNILEHLTLQHALRTKRVERGLKEAPYDTEIQAAFRSQDLSG